MWVGAAVVGHRQGTTLHKVLPVPLCLLKWRHKATPRIPVWCFDYLFSATWLWSFPNEWTLHLNWPSWQQCLCGLGGCVLCLCRRIVYFILNNDCKKKCLKTDNNELAAVQEKCRFYYITVWCMDSDAWIQTHVVEVDGRGHGGQSCCLCCAGWLSTLTHWWLPSDEWGLQDVGFGAPRLALWRLPSLCSVLSAYAWPNIWQPPHCLAAPIEPERPKKMYPGTLVLDFYQHLRQ